MIISRKLLVAALTLGTLNPFTLDAMKRQNADQQDQPVIKINLNKQAPTQQPAIQVEPTFGVGIEQACLHLACNLCPEDGIVAPEIGAYIFSLYSEISTFIDDIVAHSDNLNNLLEAIERVLEVYGPDVTAKLVKFSLTEARVSLGDIGKNNNDGTSLHWVVSNFNADVVKVFLANALTRHQAWGWIDVNDIWRKTALHHAVVCGKKDMVKVLFAVAPTPKQAWELLCSKDFCGKTALHIAISAATCQHSREQVIKDLLTAANDCGEGKVWEFIHIKDTIGQTAFNLANDEVKQIMQQYRPLKKQYQEQRINNF